MRDRVSRRAAITSLAGGLLSLSACGGGDSGGTKSGSGSVESSNSSSLSISYSGATALVNVSGSDAVSQRDSDFLGLSFEKFKLRENFFTSANQDLVNLFKLLGISTIRVGAGSVDGCAWMGAPNQSTILPVHVDNLAAFARVADCKIVYGLNFAQNTPERAVSEAQYASSVLGEQLDAFELGNEPDVYYLNYRPTSYTYDEFVAEWHAMKNAISLAIPSARFVGPSCTADLSFSEKFASDARRDIVSLTHHYYKANGILATSTADSLLTADPNLDILLSGLKSSSISNGIEGGFRINECNSFWHGGAPGVSNAYVSALWVIDFLFKCWAGNAAGINIHNIGNALDYSPIGNDGGVVNEVRPIYYGMMLFQLASKGNLAITSVQILNSTANFSAYAILAPGGVTQIVLVNKDPLESISAYLNLDTSSSFLTPLALSGASLSALTGQVLGNSPIEVDGMWNPAYGPKIPISNGQAELSVPPLTAIWLK